MIWRIPESLRRSELDSILNDTMLLKRLSQTHDTFGRDPKCGSRPNILKLNDHHFAEAISWERGHPCLHRAGKDQGKEWEQVESEITAELSNLGK
jgi:hypothetical protein